MTASGSVAVASFLAEGAPVRSVEPGLWSVLSASAPGQPYDRRAAVYDTLIGSAWYNRAIWGADHRSYAAFARQALDSGAGLHLDAGCGSLVGTAPAYEESARSGSTRPWLLVDASLGMLGRARARLGTLSHRAVLLQADLRTVPLRSRSIDSALCMGMLHLFDSETAAAILARIHASLEQRGTLFLTSLVLGRPRGDRVLHLLHRAGEVGLPRTREAALRLVLEAGFEVGDVTQVGNMLYVGAFRS